MGGVYTAPWMCGVSGGVVLQPGLQLVAEGCEPTGNQDCTGLRWLVTFRAKRSAWYGIQEQPTATLASYMRHLH